MRSENREQIVRGAKRNGGVSSKRILIVAAIILAVVGAAGTIYFYQKYQAAIKDPNTTQQAADNAANALRDKVAKLMLLPSETPVVGTVEDASKQKDQPFFKDAQNGDRILVFTASKKAIIYRESENKIINVGPVTGTSAEIVVSILGSKDKAQEAARAAQSKFGTQEGATFVTGAAKSNFSRTQVYDVTGENSELVKQLAEKANGTVVTTAPSGETIPSGASIVVFAAQ